MQELSNFLQQAQISQTIMSIGLLLSRILGMIFMAPFLGGKIVPNQVRMGIAIAIAILIYPAVVTSGSIDSIFSPTGPAYPFALRMTGYLAKEIFIGFILGFVISTIWHMAEMVGRFVDTGRGSAMGQTLVPQLGSQSSQFGSLYYQLLILVFLAVDGHLIFLDFFIRSYLIVPVSYVPRFDTGMWALFDLLVRTTSHLFVASVMLAAPLMLIIFLTDICMGLVNKVAPQVQVTFVGMPLKAVAGVWISMVALALFVQQSEVWMARTLAQVWDTILLLKPY